MSKRGDANIWWIIIGAVIALVVLVVLMLIFTGKTGGLSKGLSDCEGKGGACVQGEICPKNSLYSSAFDCKEGKRCCVGTPKACPLGTECAPDEQCQQGYCYAQ